MARVQLCAAIPPAVLFATDGSATSGGGLVVKIPEAGQLASINTTVYLAATGGTTIAPAALVTNPKGELPGFVEQGTWLLTLGATVYKVEAVVGDSVLALESDQAVIAADVAVIKEAPINLRRLGAIGDGTANPEDQTAFDDAIDLLPADGGEIYGPAGAYIVNMEFDQNSVTLLGDGRGATTFAATSGDLLTLAPSAVGGIIQLALRGLTLQANSGAGHVIKALGNVAESAIVDCHLRQLNAGKSIWHQDDDGHYIDNTVERCHLEHVAGATVPGWYFRSHNAVSANCNRNAWRDFRMTYSGEFFFHIEMDVVGFNYDNHWSDYNGEIVDGGVAKLLGALGCSFKRGGVYDLSGATTRDLYWIGKHASGSRCMHTKFEDMGRRGGSLGASKADIRVDNAYFTTIDNVEAGSAGPTIELNSNPYVTLRNLSDLASVLNADGGNVVWDCAWRQTPPTTAAAAAPNSSLFIDSTSGKVRWKNAAGTSNDLY